MPASPASTTADELLDVAEALFAEHGLEGVSVRRINQAAGRNPAAVHYHFGSRDKLLQALVERRMEGVMARRTELLSRIESGEVPGSVRHLVEVLVRPLADLLVESPEVGRRHVQLLAWIFVSRANALHTVIRERFAQAFGRWFQLLSEALPDVPSDVLATRVWILSESVVHGLAKAPGPDVHSESTLGPEAYLATLIDTLSAGLSAPATPLPEASAETKGVPR